MKIIFTIILGSFIVSSPVYAEELHYVGSGSCGATSCHGSTEPLRDQWTLWSTKDKHSKAYSSLFEKRSTIIASRLKLATPAHQDPSCLRCHSMNVPTHLQGKSFDINDGVGCESCHGAAEKWLEPHSRNNWNHEQSVSAGMTSLRDMTTRGETCLKCHSQVDHQLLGAGHPDVTFELDTFSAVMPKHWREKSSFADANAWAIGQILSFQKHISFLKETTEKYHRIDESFLNCFSCHHNLYDMQWTPASQVIGRSSWNPAKYAVLRNYLLIDFPELTTKLDQNIKTLTDLIHSQNPDLSKIPTLCAFIEKDLGEIGTKLKMISWSSGKAVSVMKNIAGDESLYQPGDFRTAEQALMALDSLSLSAQNPSAAWKKTRKEIKQLFDVLDLKDPAHYKAETFHKAVSALKESLGNIPVENSKTWWRNY